MLERDTLFQSVAVSGCCAAPSRLDLVSRALELHGSMLLLSSLSPMCDFSRGKRKRQQFWVQGEGRAGRLSERGSATRPSPVAAQAPPKLPRRVRDLHGDGPCPFPGPVAMRPLPSDPRRVAELAGPGLRRSDGKALGRRLTPAAAGGGKDGVPCRSPAAHPRDTVTVAPSGLSAWRSPGKAAR